jgi:tripartite-type tricarboxylate transporter receptor subunit TctC
MNRKKFLTLLACAIAGVALHALPAAADDYPSRPLRLIVPFPPGGSSDTIARDIASHLSTTLGQPVIVDNRPGAGGNIGMQAGAASPPDGYTIILGSTSTLAINPFLYKKLTFDARKNFAPIALAAAVENVLLINTSVPATNFAQFVAYLKANSGKINFASPGSGNTSHLAAEMFKRRVGVDITHVPYKGDLPALTDLIGGQVQMMFATVPVALPYIQSGRLKALVIAGPSRSKRLPDVPSMADVGIDNFNADAWFGFVAPKGTPTAIINKLNRGINAALDSPKVKNGLIFIGYRPTPMSVTAFADMLPREWDKWGQMVKESGASID